MHCIKPFLITIFILTYVISCSYVADVYIENQLQTEIKVSIVEYDGYTNTFIIQPNDKTIVTGLYSKNDFLKQVLIFTNEIIIYSNGRDGFWNEIEATQLVEQDGCAILPDPIEYLYIVK